MKKKMESSMTEGEKGTKKSEDLFVEKAEATYYNILMFFLYIFI